MKAEFMDWQDALARVRHQTKPLGTEIVHLQNALGRVASTTCTAKENSPRFDNSAVDGYAICDSTEFETGFELIGEMFAGSDVGTNALAPGQALRVLTGAPIPATCDRVLMQEDCYVVDGIVECEDMGKSGQHIRRAGEDFFSGAELVLKGQLFNSARIALLAAAGVSEVDVMRLPIVGLLTTGDEVRDIGSELRSGEIYNSNSIAIRSALNEIGISDVCHVHVPDCFEQTRSALSNFIETCDVVVTVGGLADGERDHVLGALAELGGETVFSRVAIKPGKPVSMLNVGKKSIFCLPGNPVSALVTCFLFVRYYLMLIQGMTGEIQSVELTCGAEIIKKAGRVELVPGVIQYDKFIPQSIRGSHRMKSLVGATHIGLFPTESTVIEVGDEIEVIPFDWRLS